MSETDHPIVEYKKNYGTASEQSISTLVYCVHGKSSKTCCERVDLNDIDKHCHKPRTEGQDRKARKKLLIASGLCIVFIIVEVIGGILSNSLAIATDAAHLLTDFASFMISLFAIWIAGRPSTKKMSFGWYRAEVIGALASVLMIWVITAILVYLAIQRCITQEFEVEAKMMLITSIIAILVNLLMGWQLHSSHSHTHSHGSGDNLIQETENINVRAAFIHVLGDVLQSVGVLIAAIVIYFVPEWKLADPICTFLFSIVVLGTTFAIMKDTLLVLMEGTPTYLEYTEVLDTFLRINGVVRVHNLRIWALSINKVALSAHLAIVATANPEEVLKEAVGAVHSKYSFFETTLQIERFQPDMEDCSQCVCPEN
ncbi:hypothetical protein HA402_012590 [Bradysia odoriphaga]|nr:hypothetical protein HA402_012590 [Bradysia odoriphaga]